MRWHCWGEGGTGQRCVGQQGPLSTSACTARWLTRVCRVDDVLVRELRSMDALHHGRVPLNLMGDTG